MTARTPETERAAKDVSKTAGGQPDPAATHFARTRAALHQYRLDHMVDQDRAAFDEAEPDWSATTRLPTLLAVGGVALAALIAAYLPFTGGPEDTDAPDLGSKVALQSQVPTNPVPPDTAPASNERSAGRATPAIPQAAASVDRPDGEPDEVVTGAHSAAAAEPPPAALPSRPPLPSLAATSGAAPPDTDASPKPSADGDRDGPGAFELTVLPAPSRQRAAPAAPSLVPVTTARANDQGSSAPTTGGPQQAPQPVFRLQLVSVSGEEAAHRAWDMYKHDFASLIGRLEPAIEPAEVGGRTMFRVQAGDFHDRGAAEKVCRQLRDQGDIDCFVVSASSGT